MKDRKDYLHQYYLANKERTSETRKRAAVKWRKANPKKAMAARRRYAAKKSQAEKELRT
jgi:hypothetical protein